MKKTTNTSAPTTLKNWIWNAPMRFALFMTVMIFIASAISILLGLYPGIIMGTLGLVTAIILPVYTVFLIIRMIRRLDTDATPMDRESFIAASSIMEFIIRPLNIILGLAGLYIATQFLTPQTTLIGTTKFILLPLLISVFAFYCVGLWICNLYATYLRARAMGVSKLRAILSMPFASMLWLAGYFIPDDGAPRTRAIASTNKTYNRVVNWIMARPANTALAYLIISMTTFITAATIGLGLTIVPLVIFVLFVAIMGVGALRRNINGLYSIVAVALNIAAIFATISIFATAVQTQHPTTNTIQTTQQMIE